MRIFDRNEAVISSTFMYSYLSERSIHSGHFVDDINWYTNTRRKTTAPANSNQPSRILHAVVCDFGIEANGCDENELLAKPNKCLLDVNDKMGGY